MELEKTKYKSVFISDLHIGSKHCRIEKVLEFLKSSEFDNLFLVGDIVDFWELKRKRLWNKYYNRFLQKMLKLSKGGVKIVYTYGNHDDCLKNYSGISFENISITDEFVHTTLSGEKILVIHGDFADGLLKYNVWLQKLGSSLYDFILEINHFVNFIAKKFGRHYSLALFLKQKVKNASSYINKFEEALCIKARQSEVDSILCGHIHKPAVKKIDDINYYNCGSWVEQCTALVEMLDGEIKLISL